MSVWRLLKLRVTSEYNEVIYMPIQELPVLEKKLKLWRKYEHNFDPVQLSRVNYTV